MKKRLLFLTLMLVLLLSLLTITASAETYSGTCGDNLTWGFDSASGALIIEGTGDMAAYGGLNQVPWWTYRKVIKTVEIAEGVTSIASFAFNNHAALTGINLPTTITAIGEKAFYGCTALLTVAIGSESSVEFGTQAFGYCPELLAVTLGSGVTEVPAKTFQNCNKIAEIYYIGSDDQWEDVEIASSNGGLYDMPANKVYCMETPATGDTKDATWTFDPLTFTLTISGVGAMKDYEDVTECGWYAYRTAVRTIVVEPGVTTIGLRAFRYLQNANTVYIPATVTAIHDEAFAYCKGLKDVYYGSNEGMWAAIELGGSNAYLTGAEIHYETHYFASGICGIDGDNLRWSLNLITGVLNIAGSGDMANYSYYSHAPWYNYKDLIKAVTLGSGVMSIGSYAFNSCSALTTVTLPDGVTSVGDFAFDDCDSLTSVKIGDSVMSIGDFAFDDCNYLTSVYINDLRAWCGISFGVSYANPLYYAEKLYVNGELVTDLVIPDGVTSVGDFAFYNCDSLTSVEIPDSVTTIGNYAFHSCSALTTVTIGNRVTTIGDKAFCDCNSLTEIHVEADNQSYASQDGVLYTKDMTKLLCYPAGKTDSHWTIMDGVTRICEGAFEGCTVLKSVTIPSSVTAIGVYSFPPCPHTPNHMYYFGTAEQWRSIQEPRGEWDGPIDTDWQFNTQIHYMEMTYDINEKDVHTASAVCVECGIISTSAVEPCTDENNDYTCDVCGYKTGVLDYGKCGAEEDGENLDWILSDDGLLMISGIGAMKDYSTTDTAPWYDYCADIQSVSISSGVTNIGKYAFYNCSALTEVILPETVTSLGSGAFRACSSLTAVDIPDSVTFMGSYLFRDCVSLKTAAIPDGITSLEYSTFGYCSSLTDVVIPDTVTNISSSVFRGCSSLTAIDIPTGVTSIGTYAFYDCASLTSIEIPGGIAGIEAFTFGGCTGLTEVIIPDNVTTIGGSAFNGCTGLASLTIPNVVTNIGINALNGCSSLADIYYMGAPAQWGTISVGENNGALNTASVHYMQTVYASVGDETHTVSVSCSECGKTTSSVMEICINKNGDDLCDLCGGENCGHSYESVLCYTPNPDRVTHKVTLNCSKCMDILQEIIDKETCTFTDGVCSECGSEELTTFTVAGSNMTLGNELVVNILVKQTDIVDEGLTAYLTHHAETGDVSYELPQAQWENYMSRYYKFSVPVAAAQMTDQVSIEIKDAAGNVYNNAYSTSICDYVDRVYATNADKVKTLMVDMLNYGAAAQEHFDYRTKTPANAGLTEAQQAMATANVTCADTRLKGTNYIGSNLSLEDQILLNFMFTGVSDDVRETMYATVEFTGALGNEVRETVPVQKLMNKYAGVTVDQIVLADSVCPVTATLYNADGTVYGTVTDSVESYIARQNPDGTNALYNNIMKFAASALAYKQ